MNLTITVSAAGDSLAKPAPALETLSLLQRMRAGDQLALTSLYDCTASRIYPVALKILRNAQDAEEIVCDTYVEAWNSSDRFDCERGTPLVWLIMMCRSRALDRLRHNRSRGSGRTVQLDAAADLVDGAGQPEDLVMQFRDGSRVQNALTLLSVERRRLVGLAFLEGLSHMEIAARTGLRLGTVKSHVRRALAELREQLE